MSLLAAGLLASSVSVGDTNINLNDQCRMTLNHELRVSSEQVTLIDNEQEVWRIDAQGALYIKGEYSEQPEHVQDMLVEYKQGVERQTDAVIYVVGEALHITHEALTSVFSEMFSENHRVVRRIDDLQETLSVEFDNIAQTVGNETIIRGQELDSFGDRLGDTIEHEVDEIVSSSMGSMLVMIGKELIKGGGDMQEFEQRMERMGENLESRIEERTARIEERADQMCDEMMALNELEANLATTIPAFANYPLFQNVDVN
ncbi:MAG: hypothetical protein HLUCCO02_08340 [Idiomarinaceae bacterium HL-53]|nr:MAG: hypothetical protein HLUCCO02_08340 [Idiomarinaceae bacterium HL-53]CUS48309.1 Protein of unknown function (DUF2884) [Idiomarinaceae bacterium HL-53]